MTGVEWGYAGVEQKVWSLRREDADRTLCGRKVRPASGGRGFFPIGQPEHPSPMCEACVWALVADYGRLTGVVQAVRRLTATDDGLYDRDAAEVVQVGQIRRALGGEVRGG